MWAIDTHRVLLYIVVGGYCANQTLYVTVFLIRSGLDVKLWISRLYLFTRYITLHIGRWWFRARYLTTAYHITLHLLLHNHFQRPLIVGPRLHHRPQVKLPTIRSPSYLVLRCCSVNIKISKTRSRKVEEYERKRKTQCKIRNRSQHYNTNKVSHPIKTHVRKKNKIILGKSFPKAQPRNKRQYLLLSRLPRH